MPPANPDTGMSQARLEAGKNSPGREKDIIVQSRETGDVMPQPGQPPIKDQPKSYAHFVAGGYVMTMNSHRGIFRLMLDRNALTLYSLVGSVV